MQIRFQVESKKVNGELKHTCSQIIDCCVDVYFVFPFEFGPHRPELVLITKGRLDVIKDVDVNVV